MLSLGIVYLSYILTQLVVNYSSYYEPYVLRLLLDEAGEFNECEKLIKGELLLVAKSSQNYVGAAIQLACSELDLVSHRSAGMWRLTGFKWADQTRLGAGAGGSAPSGGSSAAACGLVKYHQDHLLIKRHLRELLASRRLHPINRSSAEWRDDVFGQLVKSFTGNLVYSFIIDWTILYFSHLIFNSNMAFTNAMDVVMVFELWLYYEMSVIATDFHAPTFIIQCSNQTRYMGHVIARMGELIEENEREFAEARKADSISEHYERMNMRLLEAYLEYRVFLATWWRVLWVALIVMFFSPLIVRIYGPYMQLADSKSVGALFSMNTTIFADFALVPICAFESKGHQLYRALCSLLAHASELNQLAGQQFNGRHIYMANTVEMIRKELNAPDRVLGHFVSQIPGFKATFPRLIKVHFYYSVLNLSLYFEIDAWKQLLGDRLQDPFLVFQE